MPRRRELPLRRLRDSDVDRDGHCGAGRRMAGGIAAVGQREQVLPDAGDFHAGMLVAFPQQIAHVEVVKVDSGNAYFHEAGDSGEEFG